MSREVRRVPATWEHPKDKKGRFIPLESDYGDSVARWDEESRQWNNGFVRDHVAKAWTPKQPHHDGTFAEWDGERPNPNKFMPEWPERERTHYQMYETVSEGTPISPVMETPEALARWLADNKASASGDRTATYEQWLAAIRQGWAPSMVVLDSQVMSGVEHAAFFVAGPVEKKR